MAKINGSVQAVTGIKEYEGRLNIGFKVSGQSQWFNAYGEKEQLEELSKTTVQKGNIIEFENELGTAKEITLVKKAEPSEDNFDDIVNFEELMDAAHKKAEKDGVQLNIHTEMIAVDVEKSYALFKAVVSTSNNKEENIQVFEAHGDATNTNISGSFVKPHFIRMAETRAIARALRWYTNNTKCSDVETEKGELPETKKKNSKKAN